ncbi:MAG: radical SAM family heme chaperone HemW [Clostridia bacterium]|nr:radical SAM family heme chaperone HemW [Clostridia bacterium]
MKKVGLYIHIPFCVKKCDYCDFYSVVGDDMLMDAYTSAVISAINEYRGQFVADTVYFGGGTPSVLGGRRISQILDAAKEFITPHAEITVEVNPGDNLAEFFPLCADSGVNRVSIGLQSANDNELKNLTRRHTSLDVADAVKLARLSGIDNISLDLMLATEGQTEETIARSIDFCAELHANHISAYMLKIEENTPFYDKKGDMNIPDEDRAAEMYLFACNRLENRGYKQYEISNFAKPGCHSRHNLKYWNMDEYVGIGPSAHSFFDGKRFFYERDIHAFIKGNEPTFDTIGGDFEEYAMLRLRLCDGISRAQCESLFADGKVRFEKMLSAAKKYEKAGLCFADDERIAFNKNGFLLSNMIISDLI